MAKGTRDAHDVQQAHGHLKAPTSASAIHAAPRPWPSPQEHYLRNDNKNYSLIFLVNAKWLHFCERLTFVHLCVIARIVFLRQDAGNKAQIHERQSFAEMQSLCNHFALTKKSNCNFCQKVMVEQITNRIVF